MNPQAMQPYGESISQGCDGKIYICFKIGLGYVYRVGRVL